ncbi:DUF1613-domain-containing protein [Decorospora gaudefroyi]|uniref:tRNA (uracil-O(2)-)-methyltransferase n=1 Tax=Decorospora gaudefroyi TaxID=184978 RepID=A0A6A5KIX6_9PLEO|nr:DUF1613-domain-containing protein [Decorospora gaudefroyi]
MPQDHNKTNPSENPHAIDKHPDPQEERRDHPTPTGNNFSPYDINKIPHDFSGLPPELWTIIHSAPANFAPHYFLDVSRNLLENPNLTASHLARAELSYQSFTDATFDPHAKTAEGLASIVKHLRPECRPRIVEGGFEGYELEYTVVRKLIPRNPKVDRALMQTCHLFVSHRDLVVVGTGTEQEKTVKAERYMVVYIPHVSSADEIPFYHPSVRSLAILYTYFPGHDAPESALLATPGLLSIYYDLFPCTPLDNRLSRTALKLLEIIHKHARGRQAGYKKRVHHDQVIGQKRFQDTYAYLKGKYAKELIERWVEQTPPEKHVFEDLGIAAFLIELWVDKYGLPCNPESTPAKAEEDKKKTAQTHFPGFVDIGCGNGLLVYILNAENWHGWGFDARRRKTWDTFPPQYAGKLKEMLLVPQMLQRNNEAVLTSATPSHNGIFPCSVFIISNHADELTPWTPLLAHLSSSPFLAIPCCSHDLVGTRFRAPVHAKHLVTDPSTAGSKKNKQPSAYASLCSWVCHLTESVGYEVEREHLRIPSTRNIAVVGRARLAREDDGASVEERMEEVKKIIEKETGGMTVEQVGAMWMKSGDGLLKPRKGGH